MGKLQEIIEGWANVIVKDAVVETEALRRAKICASCVHASNHITCKLCGCPLIAKTRSPKSKCPDNKW
jgi:hypothetical protein